MAGSFRVGFIVDSAGESVPGAGGEKCISSSIPPTCAVGSDWAQLKMVHMRDYWEKGREKNLVMRQMRNGLRCAFEAVMMLY
jgi:hypothetical protein